MNADAHVRPRARHYDPPAAIWSMLEPARAAMEMGMLPFAAPCLGQAPRGDGHPVMVIPGFMGTDGSTAVLRSYLQALGYEVHPWALGRPDIGFYLVALWTAASLLVHTAQLVQAFATPRERVVSWLSR